ncbi:hypothetical protein E2562_013860 [Oryza meyeriana var. granulata]|uniref:Uncharacterized protein n=1 Tax=Oryza meyeriana var. granulata TaxID=110450 RepID=A0A6G1C6W6_9ORYZ|nr:hypothetical protein E2562_013860 [Oryza meyeriana var. granulata]
MVALELPSSAVALGVDHPYPVPTSSAGSSFTLISSNPSGVVEPATSEAHGGIPRGNWEES